MAIATGAFETSTIPYNESWFPHRLRIEWEVTSQSAASNSSTIKCTVKSADGDPNYYIYARNIKVSLAGVIIVNQVEDIRLYGGGATSWTKTFTVTHNTDGTKKIDGWAEGALYTFDISSTRYGYSATLPTIPRASGVSGFSINLSSGVVSFNISSASSTFTHNVGLYYNDNSARVTYWNGLKGGATSKTLSSTELSNIYKSIPNATSRVFRLNVDTFDAKGTKIGTKTTTATGYLPSSIGPTISSFTPSIASTKPAGCGLYVKNNSTVTWTVEAKGSNGSTITKCEITGQNLSKTFTNSATKYTATSSTLTVSGEKTYTVKVTDSRGKTASKTGKINILNYEAPHISSSTSYRSNSAGSASGNGEYVTHKISTSFYNLNKKNKITIKVFSKKSTESAYGSEITIKDDAETTSAFTKTYGTFSLQYAYDFKFVISDAVGKSHTVYTHIGTQNIPINISKDNTGVSIGGFAQSSSKGRFDCNWEAHFVTAPITGSDRKLKNNIENINVNIIDNLHPVQYNLRNGDSNVTHYGFIAQDVEQVLTNTGINDRTGIVHYDINQETNERENYALAYEEFIPFLVKKCQDLQREIDILKERKQE